MYVFKYIVLRIVCFEGDFAGRKLVGVLRYGSFVDLSLLFNRRVSHTGPAIKNNRDELKLSIARLRVFYMLD